MDGYPFREGLQKFTPIHANDAYYYGNDDSLIYREVTLGYAGTPTIEVLEHAQQVRQLHTELEKYDIKVAPYRIVIPNKANTIIMATDYVNGVIYSENNYGTLTTQHKEFALQLLGSLTSYLDHAISTGSAHLSDIYGLHQYAVTTAGPVLIDIDPFVNEPRSSNPSSFEVETLSIEHLARMGMAIFSDEPEARGRFLETISHLLKTSAAAHDLVTTENDITECIESILEDEEYNISAFVRRVTRAQGNEQYNERVLQKLHNKRKTRP